MGAQPLSYGVPLADKPHVRWHKIDWPKVGRPLQGAFAARTFTAFWTHWMPLTVRCEEHPSCPHCKAHKPLLQVAYIPMLLDGRSDFNVVIIPDGGARVLLDHMAKHGSLLGKHARLERGLTKHNDRVHVEFIDKKPREFKAEVDPLPSLQKVWGMNLVRASAGASPPTRVQDIVAGTAEAFVHPRFGTESRRDRGRR